MSVPVVHIRDTSFAGDLPYELRSAVFTGKVTVSGSYNYYGYLYLSSFPHGLSFTPLLRMQYSYDGANYKDQLAMWDANTFGPSCYADGTNIYLVSSKLGDLYYKVACYPRSL